MCNFNQFSFSTENIGMGWCVQYSIADSSVVFLTSSLMIKISFFIREITWLFWMRRRRMYLNCYFYYIREKKLIKLIIIIEHTRIVIVCLGHLRIQKLYANVINSYIVISSYIFFSLFCWEQFGIRVWEYLFFTSIRVFYSSQIHR